MIRTIQWVDFEIIEDLTCIILNETNRRLVNLHAIKQLVLIYYCVKLLSQLMRVKKAMSKQ